MRQRRLWRQALQAKGFTLIEVLASVILVAIAMAAVAPTLAVVAYRRAMSERIEVANQLAQAEVDRIRTLVDLELAPNPQAFQDPDRLALLPKVGADPLQNTPPPANMNGDGSDYSIRQVEVRIPGRDPERYVVQTFRTEGAECIDRRQNEVIEGVPCSFVMGVRVYHRFSFDPSSGNAIFNPLATEVASANQNLANADVWQFPLATSTVEINVAADLGDVCRGIVARRGGDVLTECAAFPLPTP